LAPGSITPQTKKGTGWVLRLCIRLGDVIGSTDSMV
jgi:hypothetical protein